MSYKLHKYFLFLCAIFLVLNVNLSYANNEISPKDINQSSIDKIKSASGIDYILLPNGEKVYSDTTTFTISTNGTYVFSVFDKVGNSEVVSIEISNIDKIKPTINLEEIEEDGYFQISVTGNDNESGISHIIMPNGERIDGDNGKFKVLKNGSYTFQIYDTVGNITEKTLEIYDIRVVELLVEKAELTKSSKDIKIAREAINSMPEIPAKDAFQDRINNIVEISDIPSLEKLTSTSNVDVYIKSENMLSISLDTNSVTFDNFHGVNDSEKLGAINIRINSSLPYTINAYLPTEIQNSDKSSTMDIRILQIKESGSSDYKYFTSINTKLAIKEGNPAGNGVSHGIDILLKGGYAYQKDDYKTTLKFEVEQK